MQEPTSGLNHVANGNNQPPLSDQAADHSFTLPSLPGGNLLTLMQGLQQVAQNSAAEIDIQIDEIKGLHIRITPQPEQKRRALEQPLFASPVKGQPQLQAPPPAPPGPPPAQGQKRRLAPTVASLAEPTNSHRVLHDNQPQQPTLTQAATATPAPAAAVDVRAITLRLRQLLAKALYVDSAEIHEESKFVDLGLDSVIGIEFVNTINQTLGLHLKAIQLYDHPTLVELSARCVAELQRQETAQALPDLLQQPGRVEDKQPLDNGAQSQLRNILTQVSAGQLNLQEGKQRLSQLGGRP